MEKSKSYMDLTSMYNSLRPSNLDKEEQAAVNRKLSLGQRRRSNFVKPGEKENSHVHGCKPPIMAAMQS